MLDTWTTILAAAIVAFWLGTVIGSTAVKAYTKAIFDAHDIVEERLP